MTESVDSFEPNRFDKPSQSHKKLPVLEDANRFFYRGKFLGNTEMNGGIIGTKVDIRSYQMLAKLVLRGCLV